MAQLSSAVHINDPMRPLVVDKSFIQGSSKERLQDISKQYEILVTNSFYFEIFSNLEESHRKIFPKLPSFRRIRTPALLQNELEFQSPATSITSPSLVVNPDFLSSRRTLDISEQAALQEFENKLVQPLIRFWKQAMIHGVLDFSDSEIKSIQGQESKFKKLCQRVHEVSFIQTVAKHLEIPIAHCLDETWITFRKLQVILLHGVFLRCCYANPNQPRSDINLEHDVHDLDYLVLGLHAGAFATLESAQDFRKLGWRFRFFLPHGTLIT